MRDDLHRIKFAGRHKGFHLIPGIPHHTPSYAPYGRLLIHDIRRSIQRHRIRCQPDQDKPAAPPQNLERLLRGDCRTGVLQRNVHPTTTGRVHNGFHRIHLFGIDASNAGDDLRSQLKTVGTDIHSEDFSRTTYISRCDAINTDWAGTKHRHRVSGQLTGCLHTMHPHSHRFHHGTQFIRGIGRQLPRAHIG